MKRLVIITVGKTHSGKTTFAQKLEQQLYNSVVIDRDTHAEFINTFYKSMLPKQGANTLKNAISRTIVDYAVHETGLHLILCNANRGRTGRLDLLEYFQLKGFVRILVHFDIPDQVLEARIACSQRSTAIFRSASTFEEVLLRQQAETDHGDVIAPAEDEADYLFVIRDSNEVPATLQKIVDLAQRL